MRTRLDGEGRHHVCARRSNRSTSPGSKTSSPATTRLTPTPKLFREVTQSTSIPIHTGEQIYLRENFKDLIEKQAVNVIGPDPEDVGGLAELKWIAEYADLHGILVAPHGIFDGLIGLAAHVHLAAALPQNYIAFEYPVGQPDWWYDIVDGLPNPIMKQGFIDVWDRPGLGVTFRVAGGEGAPVGRGSRLLRLMASGDVRLG